MIIASAKIPPNTQPMIIPTFVDDADFTGAVGFNKGLPGRYLPKPKFKKDQTLVDESSTYIELAHKVQIPKSTLCTTITYFGA